MSRARQSGEWIASVQLPNGAIPWFEGGHLDPWDHVQAAMGLAAVGLADEAFAAYDWLARTQRADGSWAIKYWPGGHDTAADQGVEDDGTDANLCAHIATGLWQLHELGHDVRALWPVVERAMDVVLSMQHAEGPVHWARDASGRLHDEKLITGNSSIYLSLRNAARLGAALGHERPRWDRAADTIATALREQPALFAAKPRFSMDWYYPVMCEVLSGDEAAARIDERWDEFVVSGVGARCVTANPWVTGAETCELVLALIRLGRLDIARALFADVQHLRDDDGSWWTGYVYADEKRWPVEQSTWTAATAILAELALA
jgi:hypothetical protein